MKILEKSDKEFEIIDYINFPPSSVELQRLGKKMGLRAKEFIRKKESIFKELDLQLHLDEDEILFQQMSKNPRLIERPIIVKGDRAVLGRPPEKLEDFLNNSAV